MEVRRMVGKGGAKTKKKLKTLHCTSRIFNTTTLVCFFMQKESKLIFPLPQKNVNHSAFNPSPPGTFRLSTKYW